eukprot:TRINITY_DN15105_c0_g1_i1.p1 TRINITY_DN15105_c0_g1~~TRINITY_DN15105_c0_g1_i1.p1  ORF type:complete len:281 (+),score=101.62 TRINITY_DN15105_c0_g1_i1:47-844(+)
MGNCFAGAEPLRTDTLMERCTELYLTPEQIRVLYRDFVRHSLASDKAAVPESLYPDELPVERYPHDTKVWHGDVREGTKLLRMQQFLLLRWFSDNVMAPRIFSVFQDEADGMSFDAFVVMMSALSPTAPLDVKKMVAFRLLDFDDDGAIGEADIRALIEVETGLLDLWAEASERLAYQAPPGPKVIPGWPKSSFPKSPLVRAENAGIKKQLNPSQESTVREVCTDMSARLFSSINLDGATSLTQLEFEKSLNKVADLQKNFSVQI